MVHKCSSSIELSIVVPILCKNGPYSNLVGWLKKLSDLECSCIQAILVLDMQDCSEEREDECRSSILPLLGQLMNSEIVEAKFGSPGLARNAGLALVKGPHIMFWDADDVPNISTIQKLLPMKNRAIQIFSFRQVVVSENESKVTQYPASVSTFGRFPGIWRIAFPASTINQFKFPSFRMGEDVSFIANVLVEGKYDEIAMRTECVYDYHIGVVGQLTSNSVALLDQEKSIEKVIWVIRNSKKLNRKGIGLTGLISTWQILSFARRNPGHGIRLGFQLMEL